MFFIKKATKTVSLNHGLLTIDGMLEINFILLHGITKFMSEFYDGCFSPHNDRSAVTLSEVVHKMLDRLEEHEKRLKHIEDMLNDWRRNGIL